MQQIGLTTSPRSAQDCQHASQVRPCASSREEKSAAELADSAEQSTKVDDSSSETDDDPSNAPVTRETIFEEVYPLYVSHQFISAEQAALSYAAEKGMLSGTTRRQQARRADALVTLHTLGEKMKQEKTTEPAETEVPAPNQQQTQQDEATTAPTNEDGTSTKAAPSGGADEQRTQLDERRTSVDERRASSDSRSRSRSRSWSHITRDSSRRRDRSRRGRRRRSSHRPKRRRCKPRQDARHRRPNDVPDQTKRPEKERRQDAARLPPCSPQPTKQCDQTPARGSVGWEVSRHCLRACVASPFLLNIRSKGVTP